MQIYFRIGQPSQYEIIFYGIEASHGLGDGMNNGGMNNGQIVHPCHIGRERGNGWLDGRSLDGKSESFSFDPRL
jgi:hypothetical protein